MSQPTPYWKGYDQKTDERLAWKLFHGQPTWDRAGRLRTKYVSHGSPEERESLNALSRLLAHKFRQELVTREDNILRSLALALDPEWTAAHPQYPRLVFQFPSKGNRTDLRADLQVALHVAKLTHDENWSTK